MATVVSSRAAARLDPGDRVPLRVLVCYRSADVDPKGGAALMMTDLTNALAAQGAEVDVSYELEPDVDGYDLVHAINIWEPGGAVHQMRHLHAAGVPIVWTPIYTHWTEVAWAWHVVPAVFEQLRGEERRRHLERIADGTLVLDGGVSRWAPNEIAPGLHGAIAEMFDAVDHVLPFSHHELQYLEKTIKATQKPYSIVPHGAAVDVFRSGSAGAFREHTGIEGEFVLTVGALNPLKNQLLLVEALRDSDLTLCVIGRADVRDYAELVLREGGDRVVHVDFVPREIVAGAYRAASVHANVSFAEACAQVNLEAAIAGCPVVLSNRSSEYEYFGDLGIYCDPADPDSIRRAVLEARHGRTLEPSRWQALSARASEHTWERAAAVVVGAYRRTLAHRARHERLEARAAFGMATREFVALADAAELQQRPELLARWATEFGADDPVTLVVCSGGVPAAECAEALVAAGLDEDATADLLVTEATVEAVAACADCGYAGDTAAVRALVRETSAALWV